jgi:hypothetical protein
MRGWEDTRDRISGLNRLLKDLAEVAGAGTAPAALPVPASGLVKRSAAGKRS